MKNITSIFLIALCFCFQKCQSPEQTTPPETEEIIESLPYTELPLKDLASFDSTGPNWVIAGTVVSNFEVEHDIQLNDGSGILANTPSEGSSAHIFSNFEHGDMELDIEFLMPKGSNSGIYFQSRYEIQLLDSWLVENFTSQDCGSIYERWDESKPEGQKGYEGKPPSQNASKAPGLWQHFHIKFRAPRFDSNGEKVANAMFEEVIHNGIKIHENVEVTGATRAASKEFDPEVSSAPLMIQGDHGPVAFRNIKYKLYGSDTLTTSNVSYNYYEVEIPVTQLPIFDSLEVIETGTAEIMDVNKLSKRRDGVAFKFSGKLDVQKSGDYLFHLSSDDGSRLFIDGDLLIDHDGKHDLAPKRGLINLTAGSHDLQIDYFNNNWGKGMMLRYEGPEQELRTLQGLYPYSTNYKKVPLLVEADDDPEMIRGFVNYQNEKRTHAISVGDPNGVHYTYDLRNGSLLKAWRGGFADVTEMWQGRGIDQLLVPQTMALELKENILIANLSEIENTYPESISTYVTPRGYALGSDQRPTFKYEIDGTMILDSYVPAPEINGLKRKISIEGSGQFYARAGRGEYIKKINENYYVIDGSYYLKIEEESDPIIREISGKQELILQVKEGMSAEYVLVW